MEKIILEKVNEVVENLKNEEVKEVLEEILEDLDDISCDIYIAADYQISSNNPILAAYIGSTPISWSVNNTENYEIVGDTDTGYTLNIKSYEKKHVFQRHRYGACCNGSYRMQPLRSGW